MADTKIARIEDILNAANFTDAVFRGTVNDESIDDAISSGLYWYSSGIIGGTKKGLLFVSGQETGIQELSQMLVYGERVKVRKYSFAFPNGGWEEWEEIAYLSDKKDLSRSATIKISASNATEKSKMATDYVCGGTNDDVQINAAIQALEGTGGCIELSEGTFHFGSDLTIFDKMWLKGQGIATIIINTEKVINVPINANVTISDLAIQEDYGIINEGNVTMFNSVFTALNNSGIAKISNCKPDSVFNLFGIGLILIGNEMISVNTNSNIYPNTTELLKQVNNIQTVTFEEV